MTNYSYYIDHNYNWNNYSNWILFAIPIIFLVILLFNVKCYKKGEFNEIAWTRDQSKNIQGIAAIFIVLHHMTQTVTDYGDIYKGPVTELNSLGILFTSIFFFFSGFGLYNSYLTKTDYLESFIRKRIPQVAVPFMLTNFIYFLTMSGYRVTSALDAATAFLGLTLINTNAWFMVEILILYFAFYLIFTKSKDEASGFKRIIIFTALLVIFSALLPHDRTQVNGHWFMGEWWFNTTILFAVGIAVAKYQQQITAFIKSNYTKVLITTTILFCVFYILEEYVNSTLGYYQEWRHHPGYISKFTTLIVQIILCVIFVFLILVLNMKCKFDNRILRFFAGISLELYLIHDIFRQRMTNREFMPDFEYFILVLAFSIVISVILKLADGALINFFDSYIYRDRTAEMSFETKQELRKKTIIIRVIQSIYIIFAIMFVIFGLKRCYDLTIGMNKKYEERVAAIKNADVGDHILLGKWRQSGKIITPEEVSWTVLEIKDGHMLLLSDKVLEGSYYNQWHNETDWLNSSLCKILNSNFFKEAFTRKEKTLLSGAYVEGMGWCDSEDDAFSYSAYGVSIKRPLVFVLSAEDVLNYFPVESDRIACASDFARLMGIGTVGSDYHAGWWLSDRGTGELSAMYVDAKGVINTEGKTINNSGMGIRPAMWIRIPY